MKIIILVYTGQRSGAEQALHRAIGIPHATPEAELQEEGAIIGQQDHHSNTAEF